MFTFFFFFFCVRVCVSLVALGLFRDQVVASHAAGEHGERAEHYSLSYSIGRTTCGHVVAYKFKRHAWRNSMMSEGKNIRRDRRREDFVNGRIEVDCFGRRDIVSFISLLSSHFRSKLNDVKTLLQTRQKITTETTV